MLRTSSRFAPLALIAALLAGCLDEGSNVTEPDAAGARGFTLLLTDAPGDYLKAVVTISEIYFQGESGRTVLLDEPFTTDLLTLQNTYATLVQGLYVPPGSYSELRAVVTGAYIEVESAGGSRIFASSADYPGLPPGTPVDGQLHLPSWGTSGLKIDMPDGHIEVTEGQTIVLIDFSVKESFGHEAGKSGRWIMRPRVTATNVTFGGDVLAQVRLGDAITLPALGGQPVTLASFNALLTPAGGGTTQQIQLSDGNGDGTFEALFSGLFPGAYTLDLDWPAGILLGFDAPLPRAITVVSSQTTTASITVSSAVLASSVTATLGLGAAVTLPAVNGTQVTLAHFKAQLTPSGGGTATEIGFTDANNDGTFEAVFGDLLAGDYSLTVVAPAGVTATLDPVPPVAITLAQGVAETRAFVVTAASTP